MLRIPFVLRVNWPSAVAASACAALLLQPSTLLASSINCFAPEGGQPASAFMTAICALQDDGVTAGGSGSSKAGGSRDRAASGGAYPGPFRGTFFAPGGGSAWGAGRTGYEQTGPRTAGMSGSGRVASARNSSGSLVALGSTAGLANTLSSSGSGAPSAEDVTLGGSAASMAEDLDLVLTNEAWDRLATAGYIASPTTGFSDRVNDGIWPANPGGASQADESDWSTPSLAVILQMAQDAPIGQTDAVGIAAVAAPETGTLAMVALGFVGLLTVCRRLTPGRRS